MAWNWELPDWPRFKCDQESIIPMEKKFLLGIGSESAFLKTIDSKEQHRFIVEILSLEGQESAKIEGEILDRESLQSSINKHFGLETVSRRSSDRESRMAELLYSVYETYDQPLTHNMLWEWHAMLFGDTKRITDLGKYRTHPEPMQIVSNRLDFPKVFFEAPPSSHVPREMNAFIDWFNRSRGSESILARAAITHVYFESIHPFEDGNGRIGRLLAEKVLSQEVGRPTLIALSQTLELQKKEYYFALEQCNRTLDVSHWVEFFSQSVLSAHEKSMQQLHFIIEKSKMLGRLSDQTNPRQTKVLLRLFAEGPNGFQGGLSAEKYIAITKAARATATRDLTDLVEKGALIKTGERRHTRYRLNLPDDFA